MKLDRVFLAFLKKDGEEHLLYKKDKDLYIDLNTKEKFKENDIDLRTLIYFKDSIYCLGDSKTKYRIKKEYKKDRQSLVDIERLCIVNIKRVSDLKVYPVINSDLKRYEWLPISLYKTLLESYYGSYRDLRNEKQYLGQHPSCFENGTFYVEDGKGAEVILLSGQYPCQKSMEKSKVLKLQYDVMNRDKIN